ncbi:hypothetical protein BGX21_011300 [Mortierella sp. AD011]|nr:hypothetical protein BGX20_007938 [Mortierella sp. AD010]KAF9391154.1 hypothetical protein BGX21_011300 [Mortierella sp. AD011]
MRIIKQNEHDIAAEVAMNGGFIGAAKYCTVALFVGGVLQATSPRFRAIKPPQKAWLMVAAFLGGFGNGSDTAFTNYERRDRELQIRAAEQKRRDILYGTPEESAAAAASLWSTTVDSFRSSKEESTPEPSSAEAKSA